MAIHIYNTLTRTKEVLEPLEEGKIRMYVCGPTVYDQAHVGHAMSSIVFDVIRRYLEYRGYDVNHVMNYTDVDDKVIQRANKLGVDPLELADGYISEYADHIRALNILPAKAYPRVSEEIDPIITMVAGLVERGFAYEVDGDVYFRVGKDDTYGKLSGRKKDEMRAGYRLDVDQRKESPVDFALWKSAKPGEPSWESPWGKGRPGWHIECSAMALTYLGEEIDIHGGGNDLVFPHHENEIAQSECFTGKPFSRYWTHNGMMQLGGEAMSKSTGNVFTIEAFLEKHEAEALRLLILGSNYRGPLTFNDEVIDQAERGLARLRSALRPAAPAARDDEAGRRLKEAADEARRGFEASMDDDFNSPGALGHLFDFVRNINAARDQGVDSDVLGRAQATLVELSGVLGLRLEREEQKREAAPFIDLLIEIREELRMRKMWDLSDVIRDQLLDLGVVLEDGKDGTVWRIS
ncbi:MAG: cysteine--tRNA ligase [Anaerolineales bacterium]|nr:cysteine--tRNA ligase [Anaerolineales bacterium]